MKIKARRKRKIEENSHQKGRNCSIGEHVREQTLCKEQSTEIQNKLNKTGSYIPVPVFRGWRIKEKYSQGNLTRPVYPYEIHS